MRCHIAFEMILEAAVNGHADAIVTHNTRDFRPAKPVFDIDVLTPAEFLKRVTK